MGRYDTALARAVLEFAREHSAEITGSGRPLVALGGFSCPGWEFDTVAAVSPGVHDNHAQDDADLHKATYTLLPGHRFEFSGTETEEEAIHLFRNALQPTKLDRAPVPFLRMRYDNTRTKSHSVGPDRGLAPPVRPIEYREGGPHAHFQARVPAPYALHGHDIAADVVKSRARGDDRRRTALPWTRPASPGPGGR